MDIANIADSIIPPYHVIRTSLQVIVSKVYSINDSGIELKIFKVIGGLSHWLGANSTFDLMSRSV